MTEPTLARLPGAQEGARRGAAPRRLRLQSSKPLAQWRKARAVELATQGRTYQQIADELGYANRGTVYRVVQQTLEAHQADSVETLRALEVARLDALPVQLWPAAMAGDVHSVLGVVRIVMARSRLQGLLEPNRRAGLKCRQPQTVILQKDDCRLRACRIIAHGR